jgi:hypothetical protein
MARELFDEAAYALVGFVPPDLADFLFRTSSMNLKVWYGEESREHYEIQFASGHFEIGFHAEHPNPDRNDAVLARLLDREREWRKLLGRNVEAGPYLGRQSKTWRRVSEVWDDEDVDDDGAAIEAASRLGEYIAALEPARRGLRSRAGRRARR